MFANNYDSLSEKTGKSPQELALLIEEIFQIDQQDDTPPSLRAKIDYTTNQAKAQVRALNIDRILCYIDPLIQTTLKGEEMERVRFLATGVHDKIIRFARLLEEIDSLMPKPNGKRRLVDSKGELLR